MFPENKTVFRGVFLVEKKLNTMFLVVLFAMVRCAPSVDPSQRAAAAKLLQDLGIGDGFLFVLKSRLHR